MTPIVLAITLVAAVLVLFAPRKYALAGILVTVFLTPGGQQIYAAGFHFFVVRILIFAGAVRMLMDKSKIKGPFLEGGLTRLDKLFCWWALFRGLTFILLWREGGAVTYEVAFWLDAYGAYFLFRFLVRNEEDVLDTAKTLAVVAAITAVCMAYEFVTHVNAFNALRGYAISPWIREGKVRAQGVFTNSITGGSFGAVLLPLFLWLLKERKTMLLGAVGLLSAVSIVVTSTAGTPTTTAAALVAALCLWPMRNQLRALRWGLVAALIGLMLVMNAPVWYVIAHVDFIGGAHAWDRAFLLDQFSRHFGDWWLLGTKGNASWGADTWDACNQFVAEGTGGGLISLVLFIWILKLGFSMVGKARKKAQGDRRQEWFFWCMGLMLFAHLMTCWGIDYFDAMKFAWYLCLALIPAATLRYRGAMANSAKPVEVKIGGALPEDLVPVGSGRSGGLSY